MKVTYRQLADDIIVALANLPFSDNVIMDVAEQQVKLDQFMRPLLMAKSTFIKKHTNGQEQITNRDKNWEKFQIDWNKQLEKEVDIGELIKLKKSDIDKERLKSIQGAQNLLKVLMVYGMLGDEKESK